MRRLPCCNCSRSEWRPRRSRVPIRPRWRSPIVGWPRPFILPLLTSAVAKTCACHLGSHTLSRAARQFHEILSTDKATLQHSWLDWRTRGGVAAGEQPLFRSEDQGFRSFSAALPSIQIGTLDSGREVYGLVPISTHHHVFLGWHLYSKPLENPSIDAGDAPSTVSESATSVFLRQPSRMVRQTR